MKNTIKIVTTYVSVILGAGFISGKELFHFFGNYKYLGLFTLLISCMSFGVILKKQLTIISRNNIEQYHDFSSLVFEKNTKPIIEYITLLFLFVTMSTMISAFCTAITETFLINPVIPKTVIFVLTIFILMRGINFIVILNTILTPIMFFGILVIGIYLISQNSIQTFSNISFLQNNSIFKALFFAILYMSFNSLTSIPMISNLSEYITKKNILTVSIICSAILFCLGFLLLYPMILDFDYVKKTSIPILTMLSKNSMLIKNIYLIVLLCAIFSTLIATSLSFINTIEKIFKLKENNILLKIFIISLCLIFSNLGFANFVSIVYPIFGILGILQIYYIITY